MSRVYIGDVDDAEFNEFRSKVVSSMIEHSKALNHTGLSVGCIDFYTAINHALSTEFKKAKSKKATFSDKLYPPGASIDVVSVYEIDQLLNLLVDRLIVVQTNLLGDFDRPDVFKPDKSSNDKLFAISRILKNIKRLRKNNEL